MNLDDNSELEIIGDVIKLKDGTLFLRQFNKGQQQFEYFQGNLKLNQATIDNFSGNIKYNSLYCAGEKVPYAHIIFPSKPIAYIEEFKSIGIEISSIVSDAHLIDNVYYPKSIKKSWYLKADSHCSDEGYLEIFKSAFSMLNIDLSHHNFVFSMKKKPGDLGVMNKDLTPVEINYLKSASSESNIKEFTIKNALPGNSGEMILSVNTSAPIKKRLLLFGDSFFVGGMRVLIHLFEEILYVRSPFIMVDIADSYEPDVILTGNVERYLVNTQSHKKIKPYFLNYLNKNVNMKNLGVDDIVAFNAVFTPKDAPTYINWKCKLKVDKIICDYGLCELQAKISSSPNYAVDIVRDYAIEVEKSNVKLAFELMSIAHQSRPLAPFIKSKLNNYSKIIQENMKD